MGDMEAKPTAYGSSRWPSGPVMNAPLTHEDTRRASNTLGPALELIFAGAWLLVFPTWHSFGEVVTQVSYIVGFVVVLLGLLMLGIAIGNIAAGRR